MSMDGNCLAATSREHLAALAGRSWADDVYLAGSAALAAHLGHRPVHDLDFMSQSNRLRPADRRDLLGDVLEIDPEARVETARDGFLYLRLGGGGPAARVYYYPYPLIDPTEDLSGMAVASLADLGLMKLGAIISRGSKRDFLDLYLLCRRLPLEDLLNRSSEKFGHVRDFPLQALKGLADLSQVDGEPLPRLREPLEWTEIESWSREEVRRLGRKEVGV